LTALFVSQRLKLNVSLDVISVWSRDLFGQFSFPERSADNLVLFTVDSFLLNVETLFTKKYESLIKMRPTLMLKLDWSTYVLLLLPPRISILNRLVLLSMFTGFGTLFLRVLALATSQ
jgi:hypothetical protein